MNANVLRKLFQELSRQAYVWEPLTPERLLEARASPEKYGDLERFFGLGLKVDGLPVCGIPYAVSGSPEHYVLHDHWPPAHGNEKSYAHVGSESMTLARLLQERLESFRGKSVLDLGCSSGIQSFTVAKAAQKVLGLDISERAVQLAETTRDAYGLKHAQFLVQEVGGATALKTVGKNSWDCAVSNPPMVVPSHEGAYPHRDGGKLGIELPLVFLDFAEQSLKDGGEVFTLCTNPIVNGKPAFFDALSKRKQWKVVEKKRLHSHFNQSVARKQGYADQGISQIELWFLHLQK